MTEPIQPELFDTSKVESYSPAELYIMEHDIRFHCCTFPEVKEPWSAYPGTNPAFVSVLDPDAIGYGDTRIEAAQRCAEIHRLPGWERVKWV